MALGLEQGYGGGMLDTANVDTEGCQRGVVHPSSCPAGGPRGTRLCADRRGDGVAALAEAHWRLGSLASAKRVRKLRRVLTLGLWRR